MKHCAELNANAGSFGLRLHITGYLSRSTVWIDIDQLPRAYTLQVLLPCCIVSLIIRVTERVVVRAKIGHRPKREHVISSLISLGFVYGYVNTNFHALHSPHLSPQLVNLLPPIVYLYQTVSIVFDSTKHHTFLVIFQR